MYSREHLLVGAAVSGLSVAVLARTFEPAVLSLLFGYGVLLSVFVDLDHFLLARWRSGDWSHLRACVLNPGDAFGDQDWVFEDIDDMEQERLLSHVVLGGLLVGGQALVSVPLAAFTAVILYAHVLADLLRDNGIA